MKPNRRDFVKLVAGTAAASAAAPLLACARRAELLPAPVANPWDQVPAILARIRPPAFPARDLSA